jgi:hypothetical protein
MESLDTRRRHGRLLIELSLVLVSTDGDVLLGRSRDLSFGGIYVKTAEPITPATGWFTVLRVVDGRFLRVRLDVRHFSLGGFGAQFECESDASRGFLRQMLLPMLGPRLD